MYSVSSIGRERSSGEEERLHWHVCKCSCSVHSLFDWSCLSDCPAPLASRSAPSTLTLSTCSNVADDALQGSGAHSQTHTLTLKPKPTNAQTHRGMWGMFDTKANTNNTFVSRSRFQRSSFVVRCCGFDRPVSSNFPPATGADDLYEGRWFSNADSLLAKVVVIEGRTECGQEPSVGDAKPAFQLGCIECICRLCP